MKVAIFHAEPGAEPLLDRQLVVLARHLVERGDDVTIVAGGRCGAPDPRANVERLRPFALTAAGRARAFARAAEAWRARAKPDRALALGGVAKAEVVSLAAGSRAARAELWQEPRLARSRAERARIALETHALERGNVRVVCVPSELVGKDAMRRLHVLPETLRLARPGADVEALSRSAAAERPAARAQLGLAADEIAVLFSGSPWRAHGLDRVLKVWPQVAAERPKARLVVHTEDAEAVSACAALGPSVRCTRHGFALDDALAACDLFARPTRFDPFALEALHALAVGLPVVTTAADGASELIDEGVNGVALYGDDLRQTLYRELTAWTHPDRLRAAREPALAAAAQCPPEAEARELAAALAARA